MATATVLHAPTVSAGLCLCAVISVLCLAQECTKLEPVAGQPLPLPRSQHAACCLNFGSDRPQVLVVGGRDSSNRVLRDAWLFDVHSCHWRQVSASGGTLYKHCVYDNVHVRLSQEVSKFGVRAYMYVSL